MLEWMIMPLKRYADFKGRSRRKEFWSFFLLNIIVVAVIVGLMMASGGFMERMATVDPANPMGVYGAMFGGVGLILALWSLATIIPNIAVSVRRFHDRDMSGWWYLGVIVGSMIPLIGLFISIAWIVIMALPGTAGPNRFGPDPKDPASAAVFS